MAKDSIKNAVFELFSVILSWTASLQSCFDVGFPCELMPGTSEMQLETMPAYRSCNKGRVWWNKTELFFFFF